MSNQNITEISRENEEFRGGRQWDSSVLFDEYYKGLVLQENYGNVYRALLDRVERSLIIHLLTETQGNQLKAARIMGINRNTLHSKINRLGIKLIDFKRT